MDPILVVRRLEGTGVETWPTVERPPGPGAWTINSDGSWQLSEFSVLSQHRHSKFTLS